jgi:hypothetical protein
LHSKIKINQILSALMKGYFSLSFKIIILEIKILFPMKTIISASFVCFLKSEIIKLSFWQKKETIFVILEKKCERFAAGDVF